MSGTIERPSMEFDLPSEHRMIRDTVRDFCETEIEPIAQEIEDEHRFPQEIFDQLGELDLMGVPAPEDCGGASGDYLMYAAVAEELGRVSGAIGLSYVAHTSLGLMPIVKFGTEAQKEEWARPLARGEEMGAWALTEPSSGSDASDMDTVAEKDGDEYVINGTKQFITNANVANSVLVKAVTDREAGYGGISTFIVDPEQDGFEVVEVWDKMGLNASPTCEIKLDDVRVPEDRLLGEEGDGWEQTKFPRTDSSARRATAGSRRKRRSTAVVSPSPRSRPGWHRGRSRRLATTRPTASSSARPSRSSTPSAIWSWTWTGRSSARACSHRRPRRCTTRAET